MRTKRSTLSVRASAVVLAVSLILCSCGNTRTAKIPSWPDGWVEEQADDKASRKDKSSKAGKTSEKTGKDKKSDQDITSAGTTDTEAEYDNFYPDLSRSAGSYEGIDRIYGSVKSAEGGSKLRIWGTENGGLTEIDYKKIYGVKDYARSPLDYLMSSNGTYSKNSVNILVTDMMSVTGSEFGQWLISTGSESFSFYIFKLPFKGDIDFYGFPRASSEEIRHFHVKNCVLDRDLLLVAFGKDERVRQFDLRFKAEVQMEGLTYDHSHISKSGQNKSGFTLAPTPCFKENLANIPFEGINWQYGLTLEEVKNIVYTLPGTYFFKKSTKSAYKKKKAVRAVFYGVPDESLGRILESGCSVQEYDSREKNWKDSAVNFELSSEAHLDGFPASKDPKINEVLGGNIVQKGKVCSVSIVNENLPRGLYAVEVSFVFEASENAEELRRFSDKHSAEIGEYINALSAECTQENDNTYILGQESSGVFSRLLDFRGMIDELTAFGFSDPASENTCITLRMIIDNR